MADPLTPNNTNSPETIDMNYVKSVWSRYGGFVKSCRFIVRIMPQGPALRAKVSDMGLETTMRELPLLCESAEMPGRGFMNYDAQYYGPSFKMPILSQYEDVTMTFLCRSKSTERQFFDDWMELINPTNTWNFAYRDTYTARIEIYQLNEYPEPQGPGTPEMIYRWVLHDAYPIVINPQPVTWMDDNFQRVTVMMTYSKWTRPGKDQDPSDANKQTGTFIRGSVSSNLPNKQNL